MKSLSWLLLAVLLLTIASNASAEPKYLGVQAGVFSGDFGVGLRKDFLLGGDVNQISGQFAWYFEHQNTFRLDADYHFLLKAGEGRFYPLVGVDFAFISDAARFGANAGGGLNFMLTKSLAAFAEGKYIFGNWDGWAVNAGIHF
jgi:hypothetical protein